LSAIRDCLFDIFAATLHIGRPFLHPHTENAPCRGDRDPLITHGVLWNILYIMKAMLDCKFIYILIILKTTGIPHIKIHFLVHFK